MTSDNTPRFVGADLAAVRELLTASEAVTSGPLAIREAWVRALLTETGFILGRVSQNLVNRPLLPLMADEREEGA